MDFEKMDFSKMGESEIYNYAYHLYEIGDNDNAIKYMTIAAEAGCVDAMISLGDMYCGGYGV